LHILVAEDDLDAREILKSLLGYFGAHVTTVSNARDAVAALTSVEPDAVIADIVLGRGNDGFHVISEAQRRGIRVPFIAVSGRDFDSRELERAGFAAYLRKPLDHNKIVETILSVVSR
jgi:CheY-like chemotaxis protein